MSTIGRHGGEVLDLLEAAHHPVMPHDVIVQPGDVAWLKAQAHDQRLEAQRGELELDILDIVNHLNDIIDLRPGLAANIMAFAERHLNTD